MTELESTVAFGPMFSHKTTILGAYFDKAKEAHRHIIGFNHVFDERYGKGVISSHNQVKIPSLTAKSADDIYTQMMQYVKDNKIRELSDVSLFIDEAQFFDDRIVEFFREFKQYMEIFCAFLDKNYLGELFDFRNSKRNVSELIYWADKRIRLTATCNKMRLREGILKPCRNKATLTQLCWPAEQGVDGSPITSMMEFQRYCEHLEHQKRDTKDVQIKVGANDYKPRCKECFVYPKNSKPYSIEKFYRELIGEGH